MLPPKLTEGKFGKGKIKKKESTQKKLVDTGQKMVFYKLEFIALKLPAYL